MTFLLLVTQILWTLEKKQKFRPVLVTVLSLLMPLKPKLFYWTNLLVFYFKSKFYSQTQKIYKQMFIQTCFKPLIVLFIVIIDILLCNKCNSIFKLQSDYK